jgi:hypothetical protein
LIDVSVNNVVDKNLEVNIWKNTHNKNY